MSYYEMCVEYAQSTQKWIDDVIKQIETEIRLNVKYEFTSPEKAEKVLNDLNMLKCILNNHIATRKY